MSATLEVLQAGEIQLSHARVIARKTPKKHRRSEEEFLELCAAYPADTVARHPLAYQSQQVYPDLEAEAAAEGPHSQRQRRSAARARRPRPAAASAAT
ncbi:hypothetical protein [Candidatus Poriferisodalis sp.]|uniref:hypothetical protein n=1 Tax=Candidatus Poriferisodalis sp. TaxID=3101277 RepID=UPI003B5A6194